MANVYLIPAGPKNLSSIFPDVDWLDVDEYYVQVTDTDDAVVATTPLIAVIPVPMQYIRLYFLNYLGCYDAVNFLKPNVSFGATDTNYQKSLNYPLQKSDTGIERYNVRANDTFTTSQIQYDETAMPWLQELLNSSKVFMDWTGKQGQADDYLPVVIQEAKFDKMKRNGDYNYELPVKFILSNEYINIRN